jgi:ABC-type nickel/cobalt efflux system permease component RcnA
MGHTLTLMLFGGAVLLLGLVVPEQAAKALEFAVGVMLALLGGSVLYRLWRDRIHFHWHRHGDGAAHLHVHGHAGETGPHEPARHRHAHRQWRDFPVRALMVGMVHGMAGSAALILLSLEAVDSVAWGIGYIAIFGFGSILGMALLSIAIAVPFRLTSHYLDRAYGLLTGAVGLATFALGCSMVWRFGNAAGVAG